jgi:serine/threonine-protein kinase
MGERFGKFEIITKIATGGMAEIFLARQEGIEGFKKLVVIKRILPHLSSDKEFVNMFLDEARMAALLNHPNIVQIYDLGVIDNSYFIAMEYIDGVDISTILKRGREQKSFLKLGWILKIISQVCDGLYYAHNLKDANGQSLGLIHRDITPENLLVSFTGNVKITDFGIARARGRSTSTTSGTLKGKFPYMSYEMVKGMEIDSRSDIFSLGIVMWEMLTYRRLFKRDTEVASINAILNEEIPSPKKYFKNLPDGVEAIVMKALERDRDKRFQTAREMGDAIEDFISQKRVSVRLSDLGDYLATLFPDRRLMANRDGLSSSKLQRIIEIKEKSHSGNSLPLITIQKKSPMSESETVVLPQPPAIKDENRSVDTSKSDSETVPLQEVKPLSEIMEEVAHKKDFSKTGSEEVKEEIQKETIEKEKGEKVEAQINTTESAPPVEEPPKEGSRAKLLVLGAVLGLIVLVGAVFIFLNKGRGESAETKSSDVVTISAVSQTAAEAQKQAAEVPKESNVEAKQQASAEAYKGSSEVNKGEFKVVSLNKKTESAERQQGVSRKENKVEKPVDVKKEEPKEIKEKPSEKVAAVVQKNGFISIDSDPWTEVYLEGKKIGDTPLLKYELPSGSYNIVLKNSEFGFEKAIKLDVRPEENTSQKIRFGKGFLNINTNIPVEVRLGGTLIGKTPISNLDMYEGTYRITLFDPAQKKSKTIKVEIKASKTTEVNENL